MTALNYMRMIREQCPALARRWSSGTLRRAECFFAESKQIALEHDEIKESIGLDELKKLFIHCLLQLKEAYCEQIDRTIEEVRKVEEKK
jgi:hypothetical protein